MTFSSFEKMPEDSFNFDSKAIDKFTLKEKSISLSTYGQNSTNNVLRTNDRKVKYLEPNMHNIMINRLYDQISYLTIRDLLVFAKQIATGMVRQLQYIFT